MDSEHTVVTDAVQCLTAVTPYLRRRSLLAAASKVVPLIEHRSAAVRAVVLAFVAAAARCLPPVDVLAHLQPQVEAHLTQPPLTLLGGYRIFKIQT